MDISLLKNLAMSEILTGIIVGISVGYFTSLLAIKRWYSQQRWEIKAKAYSHILEALDDMQYANDFELKYYYNEDNRPEQVDNLVTENSIKSGITLRRTIASNIFYLSNPSQKILNELSNELNETYTDEDLGGAVGRLAHYSDKISKYIVKLQESASNDLKKP